MGGTPITPFSITTVTMPRRTASRFMVRQKPLQTLSSAITSAQNNARYSASSGDFNLYTWDSGTLNGVEIYNNTDYWDTSSGSPGALQEDADFSGANPDFFENNIIYTSGNKFVHEADSNLSADNNLYWSTIGPASDAWYQDGTSYGSLCSWQGAGEDVHGLYADPLLNSPTNHATGLPTSADTLQIGSPAVDAGAAISSPGSQDFFGDSLYSGHTYDIGADESPNVRANLITNGGFESGCASPWSTYSASVTASNAHSGADAMAASGDNAGAWQDVSDLLPNTTYTWRGWLEAGSASDGVYVYAKDFGGSTQESSVYSGTSYSLVSVTFTTGASNTSAEVGFYKDVGTGTSYGDDFELVPGSTNLISNGGFESGSASPWSTYNASVGTGSPHSGSYDIEPTGDNAGAWQDVTGLTADTTYTWRGWLEAGSSADGVYLYAKDFGGSTVKSLYYEGTSYIFASITFTTGASNTSAEVGVYKDEGSGTSYGDDFELVQGA